MDPFLYQYTIGLIVFLVGLIYAHKQGYVGLSGSRLHNTIMLFVGLLFFAGVQAYLQYAPMKERAPQQYPCAEASDYEACFSQLPNEKRPPVLEALSKEERAKTQEAAHNIQARREENTLFKKRSKKEITEEEFQQQHAAIPRQKMGTNLDYGIMIGYFLAMLGIGTWFGRGQTTTKDFFFGGQRFSWWMISFSLVATTIGSYSFVKYSKIAYKYGIASSQTYMNDWFWVPLLLFGWLPILYFSRIISIPEYFEKRFGRTSRHIATMILLAYLIGYVGVNLLTMGQALNILLGWDIFWSATIVASISAAYVTFGGQTSVIMTDLFQGLMLLLTGLVLLALGISYVGGFDVFWEYLPRGHRLAFPAFNAKEGIYGDSSYPAVGIFWQDAMANSAMFYFLNQGMVMRLMAAKSVEDARKAVVSMLVILMPIAALVVASGGWVGKSLVGAGVLPEMDPDTAFFVAAEFLAIPGVFGLIMAALTAALMSTVDTLVTAVSAIVVNDLYKPFRPQATESDLLKMARISSLSVSVFGIMLVPIFMTFDSIYAAHGAFTAAITPPLVVTLLLGIFWKRFTPKAAMYTMLGGILLIFASIAYPSLIDPFAQGVSRKDVDGFLAGTKQYQFMRAFFGLVCCTAIGMITTFMTTPKKEEEIQGFVWGTVASAIRSYKGSDGSESESITLTTMAKKGASDDIFGEGQLPAVRISQSLATKLKAKEKDLIYVSDTRWWLGGLQSAHAIIEEVTESEEDLVELSDSLHELLLNKREKGMLTVQRLY